jgi:hypothetical protein
MGESYASISCLRRKRSLPGNRALLDRSRECRRTETQTQGLTATSPGPPHGGGSPDKAASTKAKRADCMSQGKSQGLKGRDLTKFVKDCVNKPS